MKRSITLFVALALSGAALTGCTQSEPADTSLGGNRLGVESLGEDTPTALRVQLPEEPVESELSGELATAATESDSEPGPAGLEGSPETPSFDIEVRSGENLVLLAGWADVSVEELVSLNGIDATEVIVPGQPLAIPLSGEEGGDGSTSFHVAREAATDLRMERYFARRGGLESLDEHVVRTGETAWGIAQDQAGVPTWVLARLNPEADLDRLRIGQRLQVPVLGDTVITAELDEAGDPRGDVVDFADPEVEEPEGEVDFEPEPPAGEPELFELDSDEEAAPEVPLGDGVSD